jgi:hypothetical protein
MGITIKKKITVKTIRGGGVPGDGGESVEGAAAPAAGADMADGSGALMTGPVVQAPVYSGPVRKPASYTTAGVFAIITTIIFIILITLQYFEWDTYTGCFPQTGPGGIAARPMEPVATEVALPIPAPAPMPGMTPAAKEEPKTDTPK